MLSTDRQPASRHFRQQGGSQEWLQGMGWPVSLGKSAGIWGGGKEKEGGAWVGKKRAAESCGVKKKD